MPSVALQTWNTGRIAELDEVENAHHSVGGTGPGRRYLTQQINHAYALLLAAQFQGFCRDLHTECAQYLVQSISPLSAQPSVLRSLILNRALDRGNPTPANIGADFNRFAFLFWDAVDSLDMRHPQRRSALDELNLWRNAIAHQDFDPAKLGGTTTLRLDQVRGWRSVCQVLSGAFDLVMSNQLQSLTGTLPWGRSIRHGQKTRTRSVAEAAVSRRRSYQDAPR